MQSSTPFYPYLLGFPVKVGDISRLLDVFGHLSKFVMKCDEDGGLRVNVSAMEVLKYLH